MNEWCDICAACLLHAEIAVNPRYGHDLCDGCAEEVLAANPELEGVA